jgi:hypothetical protein
MRRCFGARHRSLFSVEERSLWRAAERCEPLLQLVAGEAFLPRQQAVCHFVTRRGVAHTCWVLNFACGVGGGMACGGEERGEGRTFLKRREMVSRSACSRITSSVSCPSVMASIVPTRASATASRSRSASATSARSCARPPPLSRRPRSIQLGGGW